MINKFPIFICLRLVLYDILGGQAKTLMFVHISPEVDAIGETLGTLKFAERVASVELGAAKSNKESGEVKELKEQVLFHEVPVAFLNFLHSSHEQITCFFCLY